MHQIVVVARCPFFHKDDTHKSRSVSMESLEGQHGPLFKDDMHKTFCACFRSWLKKT